MFLGLVDALIGLMLMILLVILLVLGWVGGWFVVVVLGCNCLCEIVLGWFGGLVWFCLVWVFWLLAVGILALCLGLCCSGLGAVLALGLVSWICC